MPTRNINLTPELDQLVDAKIQSGRFANASEVLRAGLCCPPGLPPDRESM